MWAGGETVTVLTRTSGERGPGGNESYDWSTATPVDGCVVYPRTSSELVQGQDTVVTGITVLMPALPAVMPVDRVIVRGVTYDVDGAPGQYTHPVSGTALTEVQLTRITG